MAGTVPSGGRRAKHAPARVAIRVLTADDDAFVERMMLLAGFPPHIDLPRDARQMDHVRRFLDGWGRAGDVGVVAVDEQRRRLGAPWARTFPPPNVCGDRGEPVAELAVAVEHEARGRGVGAALLDALARAAGDAGHRELFLSVSRRNPACRLYRRCGLSRCASARTLWSCAGACCIEA